MTAPRALSTEHEVDGRAVLRLAFYCLVAHAALSAFSAYAFSSFLLGPPPAWLQTPANQAILRMGWRFGGPTCVVLGALAALFHATGKLGARRAVATFVVAFSISLTSELLGTATGYPFGPYSYTTQLGYRIGGLVPFNIPTSWFYMLYCSLAICGRLLPVRSDDRGGGASGREKWRWAIVAALVLTAWDVSMDPAMVRTTHWIWHLTPAAQQSALGRIFSSDAFYGMPLTNWLGWLLTGTIVSRAMLAIVPPEAFTRRVSPSRFPLVLYGVNGLLPIAICVRQGLWGAAVGGAVAMAIPLVLAVRAGGRGRVESRRGAMEGYAASGLRAIDSDVGGGPPAAGVKIVVIGSGFGGLSAAIRLQAQGHQVTILEKRDKPGGRAYVYEQDGFTFDGGPTIVTAPWLIHELFELAGRRTEDYARLVPISPFYNIRFEDGSVFRYDGDRASVVEQIRKFNPDDVEGYLRFAESTEDIFRTGFALIDKPFSKLGDMLRVAPDLVRLKSHQSVAGYVNRFIRDERLRQVFSFHPLLVGGNPFQSSSLYALIHTLEQKWGVWFAMGGTGALVAGLVRLFEDLGGELRLSCEVDEIVVGERSGRAEGVRLRQSGEVVRADAVVSNGDVASTYMRLVPSRFRKRNTDRRMSRMRYSMSLFVIYFGTDRRYEDVAHHEILMGPRYRGLLDDIFTTKRLAGDFSLYLHRPTATDPSLAPPGCDSWYVLSPVPNLGGDTDWREAAGPYRDAIVRYLEERYLPGLSKHIVSEHRIDPLHFRDTLNSHLGSAFSVEPILTQSAWFRPHNRSEDVPNLYFAGAGTHPGAGLPGVMSSGKIVADMIGAAGEGRAPAAHHELAGAAQNAMPIESRTVG